MTNTQVKNKKDFSAVSSIIKGAAENAKLINKDINIRFLH